jgi:hypothetical protein
VLTHKSRGNTSGCAPSRSVVTRGIASRSFHCSHVNPAIFVILKSSAAVINMRRCDLIWMWCDYDDTRASEITKSTKHVKK